MISTIPQSVVVGSDPAANTEITEAVPAGEVWNLLSVSIVLAQAAAQTPQPILIIDDGTDAGILFSALGATASQAVDTTCRYTWAPNFVTSAIVGSGANCFAFAPLLPTLVLTEGCRIKTTTVGKGANSNYSAPRLIVASLE